MTSVFDRMAQCFFHHQSFASYFEPVLQSFMPEWRAGLYRSKVTHIEQVKGSCLFIKLKPHKSWPQHVAGQHVNLTIEVNGRLLTRTFTIVSSPRMHTSSQVVSLLIKVDERGRFTQHLEQVLSERGWCNISAPHGKFTLQSEVNPILMIAGGSGITPLMSLLNEHLVSLRAPVRLVYFAKYKQHNFVHELRQLENEYSHFSTELCTRDDWKHVTSYILNDTQADVYCCGPEEMMHTVEHICDNHSMNYFFEQFGLSRKPTSEIRDHQRKLTLVAGNKVLTIQSDLPLLEQLEAFDLPVKRGCGIGICHQCQCKKLSGVVRDVRTGLLSDSAQELIQLCISQPVSNLEVKL